jgi:hypothetical protein
LAIGSVPHSPDLEALAIRRFGTHLSESEKKLLRHAPKGEIVSCGPNLNDQDPRNDPSNSDNWEDSREIRAELLTWLCVDQVASKIVDSRGLVVYAAKDHWQACTFVFKGSFLLLDIQMPPYGRRRLNLQ